jgi:hypothetical protein
MIHMAATRNQRPVMGKAFPRNDSLEMFVVDVIRMGGAVDAKDDDGNTPLHLASERGDINMVETLLKCEADPNSRNSKGDTPMHSATYWGHAPVIRALVRWGANGLLENDEGKTPLSIAIENNKSESVLKAVSSERCCDVYETVTNIGKVVKKIARTISKIRFSTVGSAKKVARLASHRSLKRKFV